jgi:hypothetical protein
MFNVVFEKPDLELFQIWNFSRSGKVPDLEKFQYRKVQFRFSVKVKARKGTGTRLPEPDGDTAEELVDVLVCVANW